MKNIVIKMCTVVCCAFYTHAKAQTVVPFAKIISVKAGNNQQDSSFIDLPLVQKEPIRLSYNQNYLQFNFATTKDSVQKSFAYKLEGLDYSWIICSNCSQVQYAHLDGGDYSFQIKTSQPGDIPAGFNFIIEGNVWHKWWFVPVLFIYFLIFFGVVIYFFALFRFRQNLREQRHIHKEKMASMAELTAGIAHEIQNPLNFVNNFSELSAELTRELKDEIEKPDYDKELINDLANDLLQNQQKIHQHGQRASGIVKSMLDHSRAGFGEFQLADLNKLIKEQLAFSYRSFYATNKDFSVKYEFYQDEHLPKIKIIEHELGKALLNLFNNAFYAVIEKQQHLRLNPPGSGEIENTPGEYEPTVTVRTSLTAVFSGGRGAKVMISIKDNGNGIPPKVLAKIFQPFYTTKPTGQGTGLGLSLSYDIIKAHGGDIKVVTKETCPDHPVGRGEGAEFIIQLPV